MAHLALTLVLWALSSLRAAKHAEALLTNCLHLPTGLSEEPRFSPAVLRIAKAL